MEIEFAAQLSGAAALKMVSPVSLLIFFPFLPACLDANCTSNANLFPDRVVIDNGYFSRHNSMHKGAAYLKGVL